MTVVAFPPDSTGLPIWIGDTVACAIEGTLAEGEVLDMEDRDDGTWVGIGGILPDRLLWRMAGECRIVDIGGPDDDDESPLYYCSSQVP